MKIATIEKITNIRIHPNADKLELATILGYQVVIAKRSFKNGEFVLFIQPDSVLPDDEWAAELKQYAPKRVKAIKLRGEWSEGLVVHIVRVPIWNDVTLNSLAEGTELSSTLNITHYEPPASKEPGAKRAELPFGIPRTDEERWENIKDSIPFGEEGDVFLKVDGQSWSAYYNIETDEFGVMGRKIEYDLSIVNNYTDHLDRYDIQHKLTTYCRWHNVSLCLRGESYGEGIQSFDSNPHAKMSKGLMIFSVYNISERRYERKGDQHYFMNVVAALDLPHVPRLDENILIEQSLIDKYSTGLEKLHNGFRFEGVVVQHKHGSFKIINKSYDSRK